MNDVGFYNEIILPQNIAADLFLFHLPSHAHYQNDEQSNTYDQESHGIYFMVKNNIIDAPVLICTILS